jgi:carboxylesterase
MSEAESPEAPKTPTRRQRWVRRLKRVAIGTAIFFVALAITVGVMVRLALRELPPHPDLARSHEDAVARFEKVRAAEAALPLMPEGRSILMTHGRRTEHAVIFFHGLTNAPFQFEKLAREIHAKGWNVYIPRLPHHGLADRKVSNLSKFTAAELRDCTDDACDLAAGLGEQVVVCGLSAGGVAAAWATQNRPDVDRAVLLAPATGIVRTSGFFLNRIVFLLFPLLPDIDNSSKDPTIPAHCYPGFSSKALGEMLRLSAATIGGASRKPAAVDNVALVTSRKDVAINDAVIWHLVSLWRIGGLPHFEALDFALDQGVEHDMIDPTQTYQKTDIVYPRILELIEKRPR